MGRRLHWADPIRRLSGCHVGQKVCNSMHRTNDCRAVLPAHCLTGLQDLKEAVTDWILHRIGAKMGKALLGATGAKEIHF